MNMNVILIFVRLLEQIWIYLTRFLETLADHFRSHLAMYRTKSILLFLHTTTF